MTHTKRIATILLILGLLVHAAPTKTWNWQPWRWEKKSIVLACAVCISLGAFAYSWFLNRKKIAAEKRRKTLEQHAKHTGVTHGLDSCSSYLNGTITIPCTKQPSEVITLTKCKQIEIEPKRQAEEKGSQEEKKIAYNASMVQLAVADQHTDCPQCGKIGGGDASCGYHAAKNAVCTYLALVSPSTVHRDLAADAKHLEENVNDFRIIDRIFDIQSTPTGSSWRSVLSHTQPKSGIGKNQGEWITSDAIDAIMRNEQAPDRPLQPTPFNYTIIDAIEEIDIPSDALKKIGATYASSQDFTHAYIINLLQTKDSKSGHWIAVIAHKVNNIRWYIVLDSKNVLRFGNEAVQRLINFMEGQDCKLKTEELLAGLETELNKKCTNQNLQILKNRQEATQTVALYKGLGGKRQNYEDLIAQTSVIN